jgi:hypothetical protein
VAIESGESGAGTACAIRVILDPARQADKAIAFASGTRRVVVVMAGAVTGAASNGEEQTVAHLT